MNKKLIQLGAAAACILSLAAASTVSAAGNFGTLGGTGQEQDLISIPQSLLPTSGDQIALDDQNISITAEDYAAIVQTDDFVYVYTITDGSMPYVIIGHYNYVDNRFVDAFTAYMQGAYSDLQIAQAESTIDIGSRTFSRIGYEYAVQGYTVRDTRLFTVWNGQTYMFGSKEVPSLGFVLKDGFLEQTAGSFAPLAGGASDYAKHVNSTSSAYPATTAESAALPGDDIFSGNDTDNSVGTGGSVGGIETAQPTGNETEGNITFTEEVADFEGTWVPFEDGFQLFLPTAWNYYNLTQSQVNAGMLYLAGDSSGAANAPYINVNYSASQGLSTLDDLAADLTASGFSIDGKVTINGIPCVSYTSESQDLAGVMFFHPYTTDYVFAVVASEYSMNINTQAAILCSLSLTD